MIEFFIPFMVAPKQNRIPVRRVSRGGKPYIGQVTPTKLAKNADNLAALVAPYRPGVPLDGPIRASYEFRYAWIGKHSQRLRAKWSTFPKETKPDSGNLIKNLEDVLEKAGFVVDDSRICDTRITRVYADSPGVMVKLEEFEAHDTRPESRQ